MSLLGGRTARRGGDPTLSGSATVRADLSRWEEDEEEEVGCAAAGAPRRGGMMAVAGVDAAGTGAAAEEGEIFSFLRCVVAGAAAVVLLSALLSVAPSVGVRESAVPAALAGGAAVAAPAEDCDRAGAVTATATAAAATTAVSWPPSSPSKASPANEDAPTAAATTPILPPAPVLDGCGGTTPPT
ncbi:unnamed protein product, partial [Ectocarpus sp. 8 AP-2014]